jgi:hypothetical protein
MFKWEDSTHHCCCCENLSSNIFKSVFFKTRTIQSDSKLLSDCAFIGYGNPDNNLQSLCVYYYYYYGSTALCWAVAAFSVSWSYTQSAGLTGRGNRPSQGLYLRTQNKRRETSMPRVGFEPTIPAFERAKTIHALDHAASVIGTLSLSIYIYIYCDVLGW